MAKQKKPGLLERLRAKKQPKALPAAAVVWYDSAEEWAKVKAAAADPGDLEASYEDWRGIAEAAIARFAGLGLRVGRASVRADELLEWCRRNNLPCDGRARARYVTEQARPAAAEAAP